MKIRHALFECDAILSFVSEYSHATFQKVYHYTNLFRHQCVDVNLVEMYQLIFNNLEI